MTDLNVKISIKQIYPLELFNKNEELELIIKHNQSEDKQHVSIQLYNIYVYSL